MEIASKQGNQAWMTSTPPVFILPGQEGNYDHFIHTGYD